MSEWSRRKALQQCSTTLLCSLAGCSAKIGLDSAGESTTETTTSGPRTARRNPCNHQWNPTVRWKQTLPDGREPRQLFEHDGTLYLGTTNAVFAVDPSDGAILWQTEPSSDIVGVDDERVYVNNIFNFRTYDAASGDQVWMFEVDEKTRTIDAAFMDDRIYLVAEKHPGSEETVSEEFERLYALDATTGDVIWQHERLAASGDDWNVHAEGGTVYVAHRSGILQAFASDGTERWRTDLDSSLTYADESMAETLYLSDGHRLIAIDASDGQIRWKREGCEAPPQTADGRVYCTAGNVSTGIRYSAVDASSIGQLWETEFRAHSGGLPVVALDSVLYASLWFEGGRRLYALDATSGCRFGYFEFDADGMTAPLVAEDSVYVGVRGGEQALYALETVHT